MVGIATVMLVVVSALVAPRMMCRAGSTKSDVAARIVSQAARTRFPVWRASHAGCPRFAGELLDEPVDPWNRPYRVICVAHPPSIAITSAGEDGRFGTADDIVAVGEAR
jgi:hypothetical protein